MNRQSSLQVFQGSLIAAAASLATLIVFAYFAYTFWLANVVDLEWVIKGQKIPPESYPILLLSAWSILQRAKAHLRPREGGYGTFWRREDLAEAGGMALFMGVTFVWALATATGLTFVLVLLAFFGQACADAFFNGKHSFSGTDPIAKLVLGADGASLNVPTRANLSLTEVWTDDGAGNSRQVKDPDILAQVKAYFVRESSTPTT